MRRRAQQFIQREERNLRKQLWRRLAPGYIPGVPPLPLEEDEDEAATAGASSRALSAFTNRGRQPSQMRARGSYAPAWRSGAGGSMAAPPRSSVAALNQSRQSRGGGLDMAAAAALVAAGCSANGAQQKPQSQSRRGSLLVRNAVVSYPASGIMCLHEKKMRS